jgi:hypothetical protein
MEPLTFVTFRWQPTPGYRSTFPVESVYALDEMIKRHYSGPSRFVCVTDRPQELTRVEAMPLWPDHGKIPSPFGHSYPSCYRRLKLFAPEAVEMFGPRLVCIDLDMVIVKDITPLFDRPEDFVIWGESDFPNKQAYCGSLWMLRTGTRTKAWTEFNPKTSPRTAWNAGCRGSDQGWMCYILGKHEAKWTRKDGVYSWRKHIAPMGGKLPADARVVAFHGKHDPWSGYSQNFPWIREHYPIGATA